VISSAVVVVTDSFAVATSVADFSRATDDACSGRALVEASALAAAEALVAVAPDSVSSRVAAPAA
jgi:hypothetical protein